MKVRQRFVRFGTAFRAHNTQDRVEDGSPPPDHLCRNEIVVDVGSTCWGWLRPGSVEPETLRVVDHHFDRDGQYPSASAAVLDLDQMISDWATSLGDGVAEIWIVTHQQPDFDALCATTLVEDIIFQGASGDRCGDWFKPKLERIRTGLRWRYELAAAASITDQCKRSSVPRNRTLSAILHAHEARGGSLESEAFRRRFFAIVRHELNNGRNALTDSVLEWVDEFQIEREFLDRQDAAYTRDLRRARLAVVSTPVDPAIALSYAQLCAKPLLDQDGRALPEHLWLASPRVFVDGVFLRDPECLLFKQFARQDLENSPSGRGFVFTAIANSQIKSDSVNQADYYFSLNPEAIPGAHLYPVWALLQEAEVRARDTAGLPEADPRPAFAGRAVGRWSGHFNDPWFDGGTYKATIIVTPGNGTLIGPAGQRSDLTDDPVVRLVTDYFESVLWTGEESLEDFAASQAAVVLEAQTDRMLRAPRPLVDQSFRFAAVALRKETALFQANLGYDVGRRLWQALAPATTGVPLDFEDRHLVIQGAAVGCWNRNGVAVAYLDNEEGRRVRDRIRAIVEAMAQLGREISTIISSAKGDVSRLRALLHKVAELKWQAAQPEVKLARRFFDAIGFEREMSLVYELYNAEVSRSTLRDIASLQRSAGVLEVMIVGVYALEAVHLFASGALETHFFWALAYLICAPLVIATAVAVSHFGRRQEEAPPTSHGRQFLTIAVLFVLLFSVGGGLAVVSHRAAETEKRQRLQQQERAVAVEKQKEQLAEQESRQRIERLWRELRRLGEAATSPSKQVPGRRTAQ